MLTIWMQKLKLKSNFKANDLNFLRKIASSNFVCFRSLCNQSKNSLCPVCEFIFVVNRFFNAHVQVEHLLEAVKVCAMIVFNMPF